MFSYLQITSLEVAGHLCVLLMWLYASASTEQVHASYLLAYPQEYQMGYLGPKQLDSDKQQSNRDINNGLKFSRDAARPWHI